MKSKPLSVVFEELLNIRGIHNHLKVKQSYISVLRQDFKKKRVSENKMRELLTMAGSHRIKEEEWKTNLKYDLMPKINLTSQHQEKIGSH